MWAIEDSKLRADGLLPREAVMAAVYNRHYERVGYVEPDGDVYDNRHVARLGHVEEENGYVYSYGSKRVARVTEQVSDLHAEIYAEDDVTSGRPPLGYVNGTEGYIMTIYWGKYDPQFPSLELGEVASGVSRILAGGAAFLLGLMKL